MAPSSLLYQNLFWLLGETSEEEGEMEESETSTQEQARFNWACIWMEEGGLLALVEIEAQRLLAQVFSPWTPFLFCSV